MEIFKLLRVIYNINFVFCSKGDLKMIFPDGKVKKVTSIELLEDRI